MKLNDGEVICNHCESGKVIDVHLAYCGTKPCEFCLGKGKLDWIEQIVGVTTKPQKMTFISTPHGTTRFSDLMKDFEKIANGVVA